MSSTASELAYKEFLQVLRASYVPDKIKDGIFGAMMAIDLINDGPVTVILDSQSISAPVASDAPANLESDSEVGDSEEKLISPSNSSSSN
ncbi:unnamed protein product [Protopolystoma xenopodis]|uniref:D-aminoacyl-tRNA deacylase n=1 Tax=Protopolystoma xenopodis TaxID=117903 RepID=A0A3S4ZEC3_9PLAT|nr:unnamed protein product [Protopolystoma xenopodis]